MQNEQQIRQAIAVKLVQYRAANVLTQKALGKLLNKNRYVIAKYEQQRSTPPLMVAVRIADMIGISIYELIIPVEVHSHSIDVDAVA